MKKNHAEPGGWCRTFALGALSALSLVGCNTRGSAPGEPVPVLVREPDLRQAKRANVTPPPIHGGTLLTLSDGNHVVVGDPDRHRIVGVDLGDGSVSFELPLDPSELPGRAAEDGVGRAHVVLRGSGELLTLAPDTGEVLRRAQVCPEPRGLAYEAATDALHLACADGTLWSYAAETGEVVGQKFVARDLRDVAVADSGALWLTTFRAARLFRMEADGSLAVVRALPGAHAQIFDDLTGEGHDRRLAPEAAWRLVTNAQGAAVLAHQRAAEDEIEIPPHDDVVADAHEAVEIREPLEGQSSSYGGSVSFFGSDEDIGRPCEAIVNSALSRVLPNGHVTTSPPLDGVVLPVDVAVLPDGNRAVVVSAGLRDPAAPKARIVVPETGQGDDFSCPDCESPTPIHSSVQIVDLSQGAFPLGDDVESFCDGSGTRIAIGEPAVSVGVVPSRHLFVVQTREPSRLYMVDSITLQVAGRVELGGESVEDTGHDLFHRDSGGGIACASCHLEGAEDGHTWRFSGLGERRTQPLNVRLRGTEPFHWDGAMQGLGSIMSEVFVGRMGGMPQAPERLEALSDWVMTLEPPAPVRDADDPAAQRGRALFVSSEVGCTDCHNGDKLTNNESVDVGTSDGVPLQVPSLLGVGLRAPLMHTGCAANLHERFDPACGGGDQHGTTSHLTDAEIDDLVAYLETL